MTGTQTMIPIEYLQEAESALRLAQSLPEDRVRELTALMRGIKVGLDMARTAEKDSTGSAKEKTA